MELSGANILVAGARVTGRAILAALTPLGARTTLTDDSPSMLTEFAKNGVAVLDAATAVETVGDFDLVVTAPACRPPRRCLRPPPRRACRSGVTSNWLGGWTLPAGSGRRGGGSW